MKKLFLSLFTFLLIGINVNAGQSVSLAWDPSCDISVTGYKLYQATNASPRTTPSISGGYTNSCGNWEPWRTNIYNGDYKIITDVGNTNNCVVTNLIPGSTNMFFVTAHDASGMESDPSNELEFVVPIGNNPPTISPVPNQTFIVGTTIPPINFIVGDTETQSTNLVVTAASSNPSLLPVNGIMFAGTGINRMVILTPIPGVVGYSTVSIKVTDGQGGSANTTFAVISQPVPELTIPSVPQDFMIIKAE